MPTILENLAQDVKKYLTVSHIGEEEVRQIFDNCVRIFRAIHIIMKNDLSTFPPETRDSIKEAVQIIDNTFDNFKLMSIDQEIAQEIKKLENNLVDARSSIDGASEQWNKMMEDEETYMKYIASYQKNLLKFKNSMVEIIKKLAGWKCKV